MNKIYYICDGKACEVCHPEDCNLTEKIEHAKNFRKGYIDEYVEISYPDAIPIQWLLNYDRSLANQLVKDYNYTMQLLSPFNDD